MAGAHTVFAFLLCLIFCPSAGRARGPDKKQPSGSFTLAPGESAIDLRPVFKNPNFPKGSCPNDLQDGYGREPQYPLPRIGRQAGRRRPSQVYMQKRYFPGAMAPHCPYHPPHPPTTTLVTPRTYRTLQNRSRASGPPPPGLGQGQVPAPAFLPPHAQLHVILLRDQDRSGDNYGRLIHLWLRDDGLRMVESYGNPRVWGLMYMNRTHVLSGALFTGLLGTGHVALGTGYCITDTVTLQRQCFPLPTTGGRGKDGGAARGSYHHDLSYNPRTETFVILFDIGHTKIREFDLAGTLVWQFPNPNDIVGNRTSPMDHFNSIYWDADANVIYVWDAAHSRGFAIDRTRSQLLWCLGRRPCWPLTGNATHLFMHDFRPLGHDRFAGFVNSGAYPGYGPGCISGVATFRVDVAARQAVVETVYCQPLHLPVMGGIQVLPSREFFVLLCGACPLHQIKGYEACQPWASCEIHRVTGTGDLMAVTYMASEDQPGALAAWRAQVLYRYIPLELQSAIAVEHNRTGPRQRLCLRASSTQEWRWSITATVTATQGNRTLARQHVRLPPHFQSTDVCLHLQGGNCEDVCRVQVVDEYGNVGEWVGQGCPLQSVRSMQTFS